LSFVFIFSGDRLLISQLEIRRLFPQIQSSGLAFALSTDEGNGCCMAFRRNQCVSVLLTLVVSASASGARGQATQGNPPQTAIGTIRGVVSAIQQEEKLPLEGIQVELKEDGGDSQRPVETVTDSEGRYEFRKLPSFLLTADREKAEQCFVSWEAGFQRVGTLMGSADDHSKRHKDRQTAPSAGTCPFEFRQWWHNAGSRPPRDCRGVSTRTV
jgi:hypothetical protein